MRIRITQPLSGSIDGIQLSRFTAGFAYQVGTTVGNYLLAIGAAEIVPDDCPVLILPLEQQLFGRPDADRRDASRTIQFPLAQASDRSRPKRTRKRAKPKKR